MKSLLVIACSNRKVPTGGLIPALERYDGGTYRVMRKLQRDNSFPRNVEVKIISAKFGLIDAQTQIPSYDQRMTKDRALELKEEVQNDLENYLAQGNCSEIYIDLGRDYLVSIEGMAVPPRVKLLLAQGRIGERLSNLKRWLLSKV